MMRPEVAKAARKIAMATARALIQDNITQSEAEAKYGGSRALISLACLILANGTPEDIARADDGDVTLHAIIDDIRARNGDEKALLKKKATRTRQTKDKFEFEGQVWAQLKEAIERIAGLPAPADVAAIVRANSVRTDHVNRKILDTLSWMEEFSNAWTR